MQCKKCKNNIDDDSLFCEFCGEKVLSTFQYNNITNATQNKTNPHNYTDSPLKKLNEKMWYRIVKTIYFLSMIFAMFTTINFAYYEEQDKIDQRARATWMLEHKNSDEILFYDTQISKVNINTIIPTILVYIGIVLVVYEIIRRAFYYIIFGTIRPNKIKTSTRIKE